VADILTVEKRNETGSARNRRLRRDGKIPAVLYGHGQENLNLALDARELSAVLRHSGHIVQLAGALNESALIKDVFWDSVLQEVLHVDLSRVDASETVEIVLTVDLRGTAKGLSNGGMLNFVSHEVEIKCPANLIPEKLELKIADLDVGQTLRARDLHLPEGATLVTAPEQVIVTCAVMNQGAETAAAPGVAEPEVIGKKKEDAAAKE
jgi:large subunit ribosomal protein L25